MDVEQILSRYPVGPVIEARGWGGTAGRTFRVTTPKGRFFLRRRGARTSSEERIRFDHALRRLLVRRGIPTALPVRSREGTDWVATPEGAVELYPFVDGREHTHGSLPELRSLARTLAAFHGVTRELRAAYGAAPQIEQFALAAPGTPASGRIDDPARMRLAISSLAVELEGKQLEAARRMLELLEEIEGHYGTESYAGLDRCVSHGDFHAANLLFDEHGEVAGIFDFDWAVFSPRIRDLADGIHFFAGVPTAQGNDIWALTSARRVDTGLASVFLRAYQESSPLDEKEIQTIPWAWLARWLAIHIEGVAKVPESERGRFLTREVLETAEEIRRFDVAALLGAGPRGASGASRSGPTRAASTA